MKRFSAIIAHVLFWSFAIAPNTHGFQCNVCHSRNPAQVRMHREVQEKEIGCFDCHKVGEKLMGKASRQDRESLLSRREVETPCVECHGRKVKLR